MEFEWDPNKDAANQRKHGISFREASTVFGDPLALTISDPDHSLEEERLLTTGYSSELQVLIVAHTYRATRIRIIGARTVTAGERKAYEQGDEKE
jgi:uncharacterized protein